MLHKFDFRRFAYAGSLDAHLLHTQKYIVSDKVTLLESRNYFPLLIP
jgi:hypothetical protein